MDMPVPAGPICRDGGAHPPPVMGAVAEPRPLGVHSLLRLQMPLAVPLATGDRNGSNAALLASQDPGQADPVLATADGHRADCMIR